MVKESHDTFYFSYDLKNLSDYLVFRNKIKSFVENQISNPLRNSYKNFDINIIFDKSVNYINSSCLGFLLWLKKNYEVKINITTLSKELYDLFDILGLTKYWNIQFKEKLNFSINEIINSN